MKYERTAAKMLVFNLLAHDARLLFFVGVLVPLFLFIAGFGLVGACALVGTCRLLGTCRLFGTCALTWVGTCCFGGAVRLTGRVGGGFGWLIGGVLDGKGFLSGHFLVGALESNCDAAGGLGII